MARKPKSQRITDEKIGSPEDTNKALTTGRVRQVPWDEFLSTTIENQWKAIEKTKGTSKNRSFHGPWPEVGGGPVSVRCLYLLFV